MKKLKWIILLALISAGGFYYYAQAPNESENGKKHMRVEADMLYTVEHGDMIIGILGSGTINAKKNHKLSLKARVPTKITWLAEENIHVKKGDLLIKFDDEEVIKTLEDNRVEFDNSEKELAIALEELAVLKSSNIASLRTAEDAVTTAEDSFYKYIKLEGPKAKDDQLFSVEEAQKALEDAITEHAKAVLEHKNTVYDSQDAEETAIKNIANLAKVVEQKDTSYDNALLNRKIFKRYDYPSRISSLENSLEQTKLNLQKTKISCDSSLVQKENSIQSIRNRIRRDKSNVVRYEEYASQMEIFSPVDGVVIYGDPINRWGNFEVKVGIEVNRGQVLMTIPDLSSMLVEFDLPEQYRSRVEIGNEAIITPESLRSLKVQGKISKIAPLPVNQVYWDRNSPKVYKAEVEFSSQDKRLVSGMNSQIEIITQVLKDVISVPVEAVFEENGKYFVFISKNDRPAKRDVEIGVSDDSKVQIIDGLVDKEVIYLFNPYFSEE